MRLAALAASGYNLHEILAAITAAGIAEAGGDFKAAYEQALAEELAKTEAARARLGWQAGFIEAAPTLIPGYGDVIGLVGDIRNFIDSPETITPVNILASAAGLLPFVPALGAVVRGADHTLEAGGAGAKALAKADQAAVKLGLQALDPHQLRFSQSTVSNNKTDRMTGEEITYDDLVKRMRENGWQGKPIDVIIMPDGSLTSIDNTRVLAAREAGIEVQANVRGFDEPLSDEVKGRFKASRFNLNSWGDIVTKRIGGQKKAFQRNFPFGSPNNPRVTGRPKPDTEGR
jgi:hypothetical protein